MPFLVHGYQIMKEERVIYESYIHLALEKYGMQHGVYEARGMDQKMGQQCISPDRRQRRLIGQWPRLN